MQQVIRVLLEYQLEIQEYQLMNYKEKLINKNQKDNSNFTLYILLYKQNIDKH
jgi:hypothetical protein